MPTTDCIADITLPDSPAEDSPIEAAPRASDKTSKPLKGLLFGFAATVTVGLALGSWYVGLRIVASNAVISKVPIPSAPPAAVPPAKVYLQIAGLGAKRDAGLVSSLEAQGLRAQVQEGNSGDACILVGPFSSQAELEQGRQKLQSAGVMTVETAH
jgi:SPOR domain